MNPSLIVVMLIAVLLWSSHIYELTLRHRERLARIAMDSSVDWTTDFPTNAEHRRSPGYVPSLSVLLARRRVAKGQARLSQESPSDEQAGEASEAVEVVEVAEAVHIAPATDIDAALIAGEFALAEAQARQADEHDASMREGLTEHHRDEEAAEHSPDPLTR